MYYKQIDGLRFVAIGLVLLAHFAGYISNPFITWWTGVELFLVISGFLITSILIKSKGSFLQSYRTFIARRTLRIFPVYYLLIAVLLILQVPEIKKTLPYLLTYTLNYSPVYEDAVAFKYIWSLCVEEQFYLLFPFIVLPFRSKYKILLFIILFALTISIAQFQFGIFPSVSKYNYVGVFPRMVSLCLGALIALLINKGYRLPSLLNNAVAEGVILILFIVASWLQLWWCYTLISFCCFCIVFESVTGGFKLCFINSFLTNRYAVGIGKLSYGIYLFHMPIQYFVDPYVTIFWQSLNFEPYGKLKAIYFHPYLIKFPLYSLVSVAIAYLSYRYIESPILRYKNKRCR